MKLKNIYNREDFLRTNEEYGAGGVGSHDGFANNLSLQNTYLGKLLNGMFRSISWLWRKSKENFVINKLMGKLTNELFSGTITYCLANGINIKTGESIDIASGEQTDQTEDQTDQTKIEGQTEEGQTEVQAETQPEGQTEVQPEEGQNEGQPEEGQTEVQAETQPESTKIQAETQPEPTKIQSEKEPEIKSKQPNKYEIVYSDVEKELENPSTKDIFGVDFDINKVGNIKDKDGFSKIVNDMEKYLSSNYDNYKEWRVNDKNKADKYRKLYKNYFISKKILNNLEKGVVKESLLNEELTKAKMSSPRSGEDPKTKKIKTNVKVKQILTKRNREKYKDHEEELNLNIADVNLAEIEKVIDKRGEDEKSKVSKYVNPENLREIQLTAQNLFYPEKTDLFKKPGVEDKSVEKERLKTKWQKEINSVFASFSNIMDIEVIRKNFNDKTLDTGIVSSGGVTNLGHRIKNAIGVNEGFDNLDSQGILDPKQPVKFSDLKGHYSLMYFTGNNINFVATISDVVTFNKDTKNKSYLVKINNTYSPEDTKFETGNYDVFKKQFTFFGDSADKDIYFLFPSPSIGKNSSVFILNYYKNKKELKLFSLKEKKNYDAIELNLDKEDDIKMLVNKRTLIRVEKMRKFRHDLNNENKTKFGFIKNSIESNFEHKVPLFYNVFKEKLIQIAEKYGQKYSD